VTPIAISDWPARFPIKSRVECISSLRHQIICGTNILGVSLKDEGLGTDLKTGFESDCWFGFRGGSSCLLWLEGGT